MLNIDDCITAIADGFARADEDTAMVAALELVTLLSADLRKLAGALQEIATAQAVLAEQLAEFRKI